MPELTSAQQALERLTTSATAEKLSGINAVLLFDLSGENGGQWTVTIDDGQISVAEGATDSPTVTLKATTEDLLALVKGDLKPMAAFMQGRIKVEGDMSAAMQLQKLFG